MFQVHQYLLENNNHSIWLQQTFQGIKLKLTTFMLSEEIAHMTCLLFQLEV